MKDDKPYHHGDLREALLQVAQDELEVTGIEGFSLRKVAKRAGVSHAAPAHHFGDTNGLLTALAARGFGLFVAAMEAREADAEDTLIGAALGYLAFAEAQPALFRLIFSSSRPDYEDPALDTASNDAFGHLAELIEARVGAHPYHDAGAMQDAQAVWVMAHGIADLVSSGRLKPLQLLDPAARETAIIALLQRVMPQDGIPGGIVPGLSTRKG